MNTALGVRLGNAMFPVRPKDEDVECPYCGNHPNDIKEYTDMAKSHDTTPLKFVKDNESTYCQYTGLFACTACYIKIGRPTLSNLHHAFPYFRMDVKGIEGQNNDALVKYRLGEL